LTDFIIYITILAVKLAQYLAVERQEIDDDCIHIERYTSDYCQYFDLFTYIFNIYS